MNVRDRNSASINSANEIAERVSAINWPQVAQDLDARGNAVIKGLITADECRAVAALYTK